MPSLPGVRGFRDGQCQPCLGQGWKDRICTLTPSSLHSWGLHTDRYDHPLSGQFSCIDQTSRGGLDCCFNAVPEGRASALGKVTGIPTPAWDHGGEGGVDLKEEVSNYILGLLLTMVSHCLCPLHEIKGPLTPASLSCHGKSAHRKHEDQQESLCVLKGKSSLSLC